MSFGQKKLVDIVTTSSGKISVGVSHSVTSVSRKRVEILQSKILPPPLTRATAVP